MPLISTRLKHVDCECLKERILKRLTSCTAKKLCYAGRVQLLVCVKEVDDIFRRFLWSGLN